MATFDIELSTPQHRTTWLREAVAEALFNGAFGNDHEVICDTPAEAIAFIRELAAVDAFDLIDPASVTITVRSTNTTKNLDVALCEMGRQMDFVTGKLHKVLLDYRNKRPQGGLNVAA
ncbi:hypothetical protein ABIE64_002628 [Thalassospira sp. MBR-102]|jgi:hypothetical protein|uniref:hypothetical protein n=1 Tax=Thalassospira sp. MBR-102 TaxID=3156466 RepID=UPI003393A21A